MVTELMKQPQYEPLSVADQAVTLFSVNQGYYDDVPVDKALAFERALRTYLRSRYAGLIDKIESAKELDGEGEKALAAAVLDFKKNGSW